MEVPLAELGESVHVKVWPGVELVPENGLTFTLEVPTSQGLSGHVFTVFRVDDDRAIEVRDAVQKWTWNGDRTVATVRPTGLSRGAPYLLVAEGLIGADGEVLPMSSHAFRVIPADESPPSGRRLRVRGAPVPGSSAAIHVQFSEPVVHSAVHHLAVLHGGARVDGEWTVNAEQTRVTFVPGQPWGTEGVRVSVGAGIRDVAGNSMVDLPADMLTPMVPVARPVPSPPAP
ncbi:MAG: Ig-like domain-containing protein [Myxococcota bacterium]